MTIFESDRLGIGKPSISPHSSGEVYVTQGKCAVPVTLAVGDIVKLCPLPAGCLPVDFKAITDEIDTHATDTLKYSVGILDEDGTGLEASTEFILAAKTEVPKVQAMNSPNAILNAGVSDEDRVVAMKITTAGATKAAGNVIGILQYRSEEWGV